LNISRTFSPEFSGKKLGVQLIHRFGCLYIALSHFHLFHQVLEGCALYTIAAYIRTMTVKERILQEHNIGGGNRLFWLMYRAKCTAMVIVKQTLCSFPKHELSLGKKAGCYNIQMGHTYVGKDCYQECIISVNNNFHPWLSTGSLDWNLTYGTRVLISITAKLLTWSDLLLHHLCIGLESCLYLHWCIKLIR
jgi:hypothetical protein